MGVEEEASPPTTTTTIPTPTLPPPPPPSPTSSRHSAARRAPGGAPWKHYPPSVPVGNVTMVTRQQVVVGRAWAGVYVGVLRCGCRGGGGRVDAESND